MRYAALATLLLGLALPAHAEPNMYVLGEPGTAALGFYGGVIAGGDTEQDNGVLGAQLVYHVTKNFAGVASVTFFEDELPPVQFSDQGSVWSSHSDVNTYQIQVGGRLSLPITSKFSVYGGGGLGLYLFNPQGHSVDVDYDTLPPGYEVQGHVDADEDEQLGLYGALGILIALSDNVEFFAEYNYTVVDRDLHYKGKLDLEREVTVSSGPEGATQTTRTLQQSRTAEESDDGSYNHGMVRAGLNFYF